jgi:alpha-tubulin suppressor-like RCC1 family protein
LIFYKVTSLRAGGQNCALLTESGEFLIHGMNYEGQLGIGKEIGKELIFFGDFMKVDFFLGKPVLDVAFGAMHTLVLCRDKDTGKNRVFGCGSTKEGQLCTVSDIKHYSFIELTDKIPGEVEQLYAGKFFSMFVTKDKKVFACGLNESGQLGFKSANSKNTCQGTPVEVKLSETEDGKKV